MNMMEQDRAVLSRFDSVWARVMPGPSAPETSGRDEAKLLRMMIDQTAASASVLTALAQRERCRAAKLQTLACARKRMVLQLQGAYYLVTGERHAPGASCAVRHESAACLRCLWHTSRNLAAHARIAAADTDEPLLQTLCAELAALLEDQQPALEQLVCAVLG